MTQREIIATTTRGEPIYAKPVRSEAEMCRSIREYRETTGNSGALSHAEIARAIDAAK